jgi:EpsI family protein
MQNRLILSIVVMALTLIGVRAASQSRAAARVSPDWSAVPLALDGWTGQEATFDPVYGTDPSDTHLLRVYSQPGQPPVIVYVGFYENLATILDVHTPELCYPAQGWSIRATEKTSGEATFRGQLISAKKIEAEKNGSQRVVTWWYNAGSKPFETRIRYVYGMLMMSTLTGRRDGSLVRIETPVANADEKAANERLEKFKQSFLPALEHGLP